MKPDRAAIRTYFAKLGLEPEIADIYLALHEFGPQTISQLARNSQVERTRIYRLLDNLLESSLIEVESREARGIIKAAPIANLTILISKKEQELSALQDELQLIEQVLARNSLSSPATRVQFYHGAEGAKQMLWNETRASRGSENLSILFENMQIRAGSRFFERWMTACNQADLHFQSIVGDSFNTSQERWYGQGNVGQHQLKHWQARSVSPETFPITHSTIVYDDVVAYYNWKDGEIFGIEIYNKDIAGSQRRLFELLWAKAS